MAALIEKVRLGVITGLTREVACLRAGGWLRRSVGRPMTFAAAGQPAVAAEAARRMVAEGASGLVSFGIAGGLDPSLGSGVVVVADRVVLPGGGSIACHDPWVTRLLQAEGTLDSGAILGSDDAIMTAARKAALYREHEALAVDMESHAVATVAKETGVPFVAIRAIGDPATRSIPRAALAGLSTDGRTKAVPVLMALFRRPKDLPALMKLAGDTNKALAALRRITGRGLLEALSER